MVSTHAPQFWSEISFCSEIISQLQLFPPSGCLKSASCRRFYQFSILTLEVGSPYIYIRVPFATSRTPAISSSTEELICAAICELRRIFPEHPRLFPRSANGFHLRDPRGITNFSIPLHRYFDLRPMAILDFSLLLLSFPRPLGVRFSSLCPNNLAWFA